MTIATIAAAIGGIILTAVGIREVDSTYMEMTEELLRTAVEQAGSEFTKMNEGEWEYEGGGKLKKGGKEVYDEYLADMEALKSMTGLDYTIFYNNTHACTTLKKGGVGEYLVDTQAAPAVVEAVVGRSEILYKPGIDIEGTKYYGYYAPMENPDGTVVGMMFTGCNAASISSAVTEEYGSDG